MREITKDKLKVRIFESRELMGKAAAEDFSNKLRKTLQDHTFVNVVFASAPSQNEFLANLLLQPIEWEKVNAFHMDEYIGLERNSPQSFGRFLKERLFDKVNCREVHYLDGNATDLEKECERYAELLKKYPTDIVCLGIGENTHLAFNDPHVADFKDTKVVKIVDLDEQNRIQQVNDGAFETLEKVPTHALTLTIPALFRSTYALAIAPGDKKAQAIYHTVHSEVQEHYPSTILRTHSNSVLYVDTLSAAEL